MRKRCGLGGLGLMIAGLTLASTAVSAQGPTTLEFSFSNPGARAMGFGGAFIGLADDATAAFANPAGLFQLAKPEVSLEGRSWSYETPYTVGGRASGMPTGFGVDRTAGLRFGVSSEDLRGVSFLSAVYPVRRWSLALYRHQLANFEANIENNALFAEGSGGGTARPEDTRISTDLDFVTYGVSAAYQVSDAFSFGFGLSYVDGKVDIQSEGFLPDDDTAESFFSLSSFLPDRRIATTEITVDEGDWTLLAGFLWRASELVSLGGVYRQGTGFEADVIATTGPAFPDPGVPPGTVLRVRTPIDFPDVYGLGLAVRSKSQTLTFSFDWARVEYSTTLESLNREIFDDLPVVDDADELHAGFEYVFVDRSPVVAVRFGTWLDPDHRLRAAADEPEVTDVALFRPGDDEVHFAAGLGFVFPSFQLDVGIDVSDLIDTAAISFIYKF